MENEMEARRAALRAEVDHWPFEVVQTMGLQLRRLIGTPGDVDLLPADALEALLKLLKTQHPDERGQFVVYIFFDNTIRYEEEQLIRQAAGELPRVFPGTVSRVLGTDFFGPYGDQNGEMLVHSAYMGDGYVNGSQLCKTLPQTLHRDPYSPIVLFTSRGIILSNGHKVFGAARHSVRTSVQSIKRFRDYPSGHQRLFIQRTLFHELAHLFDLAKTPGRTNTEDRLGIHCTNPRCALRQTSGIRDLLRFSKEELNKEDPFCPQCREEYEVFREKHC